ncbi:MAG: DUF1501 domain-containing protein [Verrucomicrobiales bacterium]|nr:DUF1501 domain-containing protein [Verrucomicrobiae bacterium]MCP5555380.1 DUF1501 domain-containing protein [Akkermansiaceae bacterium]
MQSILKSNEKTRRDFMSVTAKTLLGVGALGYANKAHAALGPNLGLPGRAGAAKHIIYLYMGGGMTHMDTFDPKPGHENQGPVKAIKTNVDGIRISEYLPSLANHADKMAIIRSMTSTAGAHDQGNYLMHTSYEVRNTIRHPGMGAWLLKFKGRLNPNLPGSVFIGGNSRINGGGGFFEPEFEPLAINDPNSGLKNSKIRGMDQDTFAHNLELANKFDQAFVERYNVKPVRAYTQMYDDAVRIMSSRDLQAFDLSKEDADTRKAYGDNPFGQGCLLARRLVENDVRAVEVTLGSWDTHTNNFIAVPDKCAILDQAMSTLLADLERRGKLEETVVVLTTEFGRTPLINQNAGRDHYPKAFSSVLAGGGIKGGQVWGKTSEGGEEVVENAVKIPDFNASIAYALGLPLDQVLYSPSKRPFTVASKGSPVLGLLA